jgi:hypothetical protein
MGSVREAQQRAFPQVKVAALRALPMRRLDLSDTPQRVTHDELVALVERATKLQRDAAGAANPQRRENLAQQFAAVDREIDKRVYALYDLSAAEIAVVERTLAEFLPDQGKRPKSWRPAASPPLGTVRKAAAVAAIRDDGKRAASTKA